MSGNGVHRPDFDVAVLGSGIGGSLLGAILARHGLKVALVERAAHPRFAIGESSIPETTILLRLMSLRYDVPEIAHLSNFNAIRRNVSTQCGVKRNFSFVYHRLGEANRPEETTQFPTWAPPFGPDVHFFRQDVDAYMLAVAARYGARTLQQTEVVGVDFDPDAATLRLRSGDRLRARFVVDAGGVAALLAKQLGLREEPCPLATQSRTFYTHLVGVAPFDASTDRARHGLPSPLSQGTLHHLFDGGWMWVIPFNNHATSTNALCSVGVTLDQRRHPATGLAPEKELAGLLDSLPTVAQQFAGARAIRPWIASDRLQFSSTRLVGDRFILLPHAASFVDPLFSSGLAITMWAVNAMATRILDAHQEDEWSVERFRFIETWVKRGFAYYDRLVSSSYVAFRNFELWNAWHRLWMIGSLYGVTGLFEAWSRYTRTGDRAAFAGLEKEPYRGVQSIDFAPFMQLFEDAAKVMDGVASGALSNEHAIERLYSLVAASGLGPEPWKLGDPANRCPGTFTALPMMRLVSWGRNHSPESVRRHYFLDGRASGFLAELWRLSRAESRRAASDAWAVLRDAVVSWNDDWLGARSGS
jgi:FADH2 O2-dependent halogenase